MYTLIIIIFFVLTMPFIVLSYIHSSAGFRSLYNNLIFGILQICQEIPGIDAICVDCGNKILEAAQFIKKCEDSTNLLNNIFDNVAKTLNVDIDVTSAEHCLYILVSEHESETVLVKNKNNTNDKSSTKKYFPCDDCDDVYTNINDMKAHNITKHGKLICKNCFETCENTYELTTHEETTVTYKCPNCNVNKCTEDSLRSHQDEYHSVLVCKECGKSFQGLKKLQTHEQKHSSKNVCSKCGKHYMTKEFYLRHMKLCLDDLIEPHPMRSKIQKSHFCDQCGKGYSTPGGLRVHNRFVHGNAKPHVCPLCKKQFTAPSYLKVHMVKHTGEKNFECDICKRKFVSKEALLYHTRRHTGEKPYSCHLCDEKFVNSSARAEHIKFKHVGPTLVCEVCSRKFVTPTFLRQHMKKHHDPTNKLFTGGGCIIPPNVSTGDNIRYCDSKN